MGRSSKTQQDWSRVAFDRARFQSTGRLLIGIDEVGRGCLAGPVVAAAVLLPESVWLNAEVKAELNWLQKVNDSKKVPERIRSELTQWLRTLGARVRIVEISSSRIDEINILRASLEAMAVAYEQLHLLGSDAETPLREVSHYEDGSDRGLDQGSLRSQIVLIDGNQRPPIPMTVECELVVAGDSRSISIAAASLFAKVHRDSLMESLALRHPGYGWQSNKGYPTPQHKEAIRKLGLTPFHRRSFWHEPSKLSPNEHSIRA